MFDIGFWELALLFLVGLLVLGPERLPRVARTAGMYVRKARQTWSGVRRDIEREMAAEDLSREMREQHQVLDELKAVGSEIERAATGDTQVKPGATQRRPATVPSQPPTTSLGDSATVQSKIKPVSKPERKSEPRSELKEGDDG